MAEAGRPLLTEDEKDLMLQKLRPFLRSGLSIRKSCIQAKVPISTLYDKMNEDDAFSERFEIERNYLAVATTAIFYKVISDITKRLDEGEHGKFKITDKEMETLKWFATKSRVTRDEFGENVEITGKDGDELIPANRNDLTEVVEALSNLQSGIIKSNEYKSEKSNKGASTRESE